MASPTLGNSSLPSLPVAVLKRATRSCCSPELPVLHLSCTCRVLGGVKDQPVFWVWGSFSARQSCCVSKWQSCWRSKSTQQRLCRELSPASGTSPRPRVLPPLAPHGRHHCCHTYSLLGSCGMSNPILWNGFSSSSFYSTPSPLQLAPLRVFSSGLLSVCERGWACALRAGFGCTATGLIYNSNTGYFAGRQRERAKGNNWTFVILNHMSWHESLIPP